MLLLLDNRPPVAFDYVNRRRQTSKNHTPISLIRLWMRSLLWFRALPIHAVNVLTSAAGLFLALSKRLSSTVSTFAVRSRLSHRTHFEKCQAALFSSNLSLSPWKAHCCSPFSQISHQLPLEEKCHSCDFSPDFQPKRTFSSRSATNCLERNESRTVLWVLRARSSRTRLQRSRWRDFFVFVEFLWFLPYSWPYLL